jgi:hypothetical protein
LLEKGNKRVQKIKNDSLGSKEKYLEADRSQSKQAAVSISSLDG